MAIHARPLDAEDGASLRAIDESYADAHGLEPCVTLASLRFFARSGHAFTAVDDLGAVRGFVLGHAVFDGERPTVRAVRLATPPPGDEAALRALLRALTKSAYDAGVYDLRLDVPRTDLAGSAALAFEDYRPRNEVPFGRTLGSRGQGAGEPTPVPPRSRRDADA